MSEVDRLWRRIMMMVAPVKILATDDTGPVHKVQMRVTPSEVIDQVPVLQLYGIASHAQPGSDAQAMFTAGNRASPVIVATGNQQARLRGLQPGEVALYTDEGDYVKLARGRIVEINCGGHVTLSCTGKVRVDAPRLECTGDIIDHCDQQAHTNADMRAIYNTHTHGNVQNGPGHTAPPDQPE